MTDNSTLTCQNCGYQALNRAALQQHLDQTHSGATVLNEVPLATTTTPSVEPENPDWVDEDNINQLKTTPELIDSQQFAGHEPDPEIVNQEDTLEEDHDVSLYSGDNPVTSYNEENQGELNVADQLIKNEETS